MSAVARSASVARVTRARNSAEAAPTRASDAEIDFGPLQNWVGFHLRLAQTFSFQAFAREARDVDLSPGRFATLLLIGRNPGISQTALSRAVGSDKSTLTFALDDLVKRGFVHRSRLPKDRRHYSLSLTAAGERMLAQLTECARRHDRNLDRIIGPRDRATFLKILRKIATELGS
jgi:DNA-binding MarR family transcriptional regulator